MASRRFWIKVLAASMIGFLPRRRSQAQEGNSFNSAELRTGQNVVSLEDQLINGLRVTTPGQRAFVNVVVLRVNQGRLPRSMVNLVYKWAINRNPDVPFPYFQFALRILARKRNIALS
jgi:hypothetical protein